jgi:leucyl aminopeptidase
MNRQLRLFALPGIALSIALAAGAGAAAAEVQPGSAQDESVWITLGADAFAVAESLFPPGPLRDSLQPLDGADGVVLTKIPRSAIPDLAERIHDELHRCGGFVFHSSEEDARTAMARVRNPPQPLGGLPFTIDQPTWVATLSGGVSESELLTTITQLSTFPNRYHQHHAIHHSADWIRDLWADYADERPEITVELYSHPTTPQPSVILTIPGTTRANEVVILGAHQDSTRSGCGSSSACVAPGADDDASGIATLSEVIRGAMAAGFRPQRTVQFIGYAAEEVGLRGSDDLASDYLAAGTDVVAVLQLDMTGYQGSTEDIVMISDRTDPELTDFVELLLDTYFPGLVRGTTACNYGCSDHSSWNQRGFRAVFPFEARFGQYNPEIHSSDDTVATLNNSAAHAVKFARLAAAFLAETGAGPVVFLDGFEAGNTAAWSAAVP